MKQSWKPIDHIELLENGEAFFPCVFEAIGQAQREVLVETFILFMDKVGWGLHAALLGAAQRGVNVTLTVDGFGSPDLHDDFIGPLTAAGVRVQVFDPQPRTLGMRLNVFRRLHRKLVVVDAQKAFVGGINFSADHLADFGPQAKQDYAVMVRGPIVEDIHRFALAAATPNPRRPWWPRAPKAQGMARPDASMPSWASFVSRDNRHHQTDIERQYRLAIRAAKRELIVANAYFFPGYRLLRDLRNAARRGVKVTLILQGEPDMPIAKLAARILYSYLLRAGVSIYEYCERPLHGKVALADDHWSTVGSSNLDPLSLSLNLEANLFIWDQRFNQHLRGRLQYLIQHHCQHVKEPEAGHQLMWRMGLSVLVFHFLRRFPKWAGWLPHHRPALAAVTPTDQATDVTRVNEAQLDPEQRRA
ncbi:MAG: cardiolipin synthase ClsB [Leptothrix sp. (in: Bacteria)]|nr:cardiolipin synthase ClsB [Leptothrix sp. (in: b-proteobacteria)]